VIQFFKILPVFILGIFLGTVQAQNNRAALIIGIEHYQNPVTATSLLGVPADINSAKLIAKSMGIPDKNVTVIQNQQATKRNLMDAFKKISEFGSNGGRVFIYFSGHGTRDYDHKKKQCYEGLLSYDEELITNEEIASATQKLKDNVDKTIVLFDACHAGGVLKTALQTRSAGSASAPSFTPKFVTKGSLDDVMACRNATNFQTRGLFDQSTRLGALQENLVLISSARPDEVAWDEGPGSGGVATQALRDCLLGEARDANASGAVTLEEIRACAQAKMDIKLPGPYPKSSNLIIRGNRNLIPVIAAPATRPAEAVVAATVTPIKPSEPVTQNKPPIELVPTKPIPVTSNSSKPPPTVFAPTPAPVASNPVKPPPVVSVETPAPVTSNPVKPPQVVSAPTPAAPPVSPTSVDTPLASLATLKDIEAQRNPMRKLDIKLAKKTLKINQDYLDLQIKSSHDGYLYLVLLGSDKKSFYMLYPNKLDGNNRIQAGKTISLPNQSWQIKAAGPAGVDHILVLVADSERDLKTLEALGADKNSPFVYALNNPSGRSAVINYLIGKSPDGRSERYAAQIITVTEVQ
jgi:hypothetical protein